MPARRMSESLSRAVAEGASALRQCVRDAEHELEAKPDTAPSVREIVLQSIESQRQDADVLEGHVARCGHKPKS